MKSYTYQYYVYYSIISKMDNYKLDDAQASTADDDEHTSKCALQGRDDFGKHQGTVHCGTNGIRLIIVLYLPQRCVHASDCRYSLPTLARSCNTIATERHSPETPFLFNDSYSPKYTAFSSIPTKMTMPIKY